ncbi:ring finger domain protein [Apiospora marii]|uniref:ring finger domain protein n=1 Tax=Apiospora marii TaxID=335849 RepID=UPI00312F27D6
MLLRRGIFDFHGAPPVFQRATARPGTVADAGPPGETVVDRGLSHFEAPEPIAARMISVAVAIFAASLCLAFFSKARSTIVHAVAAADIPCDLRADVTVNSSRSNHSTISKHIVRGTVKRRFKSRLYIFNAIFLIESCSFKLKWSDGTIGLEATSLVSQEINTRLRKLTVRAFFGSLFTLTSTSTNLIALMLLEGEPAWLCLLSCKTDVGSADRSLALVLVCTVVMYWITTIDDDLMRDAGASRREYAPATAMSQLMSSARGRELNSRRAGVPPIVIIPPTPQFPNNERFGPGSLDTTPTPLPTAYRGVLPSDPPHEDKGKGAAVYN